MTAGVLSKWFERGFGFIEPDAGGENVFIHVSALRRAGITGEPEVGQRFVFSIREQSDGRLSAEDIVLAGATVKSPADDEMLRFQEVMAKRGWN